MRKVKIDRIIQMAQKDGIDVRLANEILEPLQFISSGSLLIDKAIGHRGYPRGKIVEIFGDASSGKTLLMLLTMANCTKKGLYVVHCDLENAFDRLELNEWRLGFGINPELVFTIPAGPAESVINTSIAILKELGEECGMVAIDSAGALATSKALEKDGGEIIIAETARLLNVWCKKLKNTNKNAVIMILNHVMANIGSLSFKPIPKGGHGLKHFADVILELRGKAIGANDGFTGITHHELDVNVYKNKIERPKNVVHCVFDYSLGGFDNYDELVVLGTKLGIIEQKGAYYYLPNESDSFQGKEAVKQVLLERSDIRDNLFLAVTGKTVQEYYA